MPRRRRINKRRNELTLGPWLTLTIGPIPGHGPEPGSEEMNRLRALYFEHRARLVSEGLEDTWGYRVFELGEAPDSDLKAV